MTDQTYLRRVLAIFDGYDSGVFTLPDELLARRDRYRQIDTAAAALTAPAVSESQAIKAAGDTVAAGGKLDLAPIGAARAAADEFKAGFASMRRALNVVAADLTTCVHDLADEIVTEHLAPTQTKVLAAVGPAHDAYSKYGRTQAELLNAPKTARDAFLVVDKCEHDFTAIRAAMRDLRQATDTAPILDHEGLFAVINNCEHMWPQILSHRNMAGGMTPPWPTDSRGYLLYLARPDVQTWCPTGAEQDDRWREVFEGRATEHQERRRYLESLGQYVAGSVRPFTTNSGAA